MKFLKENSGFIALIALIAITTLFSLKAKADSVEVLLGGWSYHTNRAYVENNQYVSYNESHDVLGVKYKNVILSKFVNSYGEDSVVLAYDFVLTEFNVIGLEQTLSVPIGVVHGYTEAQTKDVYLGKGLSLYVMPTLHTELFTYKDLTLGLNLGIIPSNVLVFTSMITVNYTF